MPEKPLPSTQHAWPGLDRTRLPRHVAVIMDGNRRWAKKKLLGGFQGHRAGAETVRVLTRLCSELNIPYLTVYAFSTENWQRSDEEVAFLMSLFEEVIQREIDELDTSGVRMRFIGNVAGLPATLQRKIQEAELRTSVNSKLNLNVAVNYGGRHELVLAARKLADRVLAGEIGSHEIDEAAVQQSLYTHDQPDPDLLIRTSGEARLSNFLLWQLAYTEIYFTDALWPEFRQPHFLDSLLSFQARDRRFGANGPERVAKIR